MLPGWNREVTLIQLGSVVAQLTEQYDVNNDIALNQVTGLTITDVEPGQYSLDCLLFIECDGGGAQGVINGSFSLTGELSANVVVWDTDTPMMAGINGGFVDHPPFHSFSSAGNPSPNFTVDIQGMLKITAEGDLFVGFGMLNDTLGDIASLQIGSYIRLIPAGSVAI
jgi:hypothetical protein